MLATRMGYKIIPSSMNTSPDSWYQARSASVPKYTAFKGKGVFDVAVIGGGLAGITAALEIARRGKSVALFETECVGSGASGRNGGFVSAGFAESIEKIAARIGAGDARALMGLSQEGVDYIRGAIKTFSMTEIDPVSGWLNAQRFDDRSSMIERAERSGEKFGRPLEYMDIDKVRSLLKSERYFQGLYDADAFHLDPLQYTQQLAGAASAAGVSIFENSDVVESRESANGFELVTSGGTARCGKIIVAGSAYLKRIFPEIRRGVLPVATHVVVTEPFFDAPDHAINFSGAVSDTRRAGNYYRLLPDKGDGVRLLWGGRITTGTRPPQNLASQMQRDIARTFPQLGQVEIEHAWSGLMGYATHKMPLIGEIKPGIWACTAFGGHGLNATAMGGLVVARAICEDDDRVNLFDHYRAEWGGGIFSQVITQSIYWFMQARDGLDELRPRRDIAEA